MRKIRSAVKRIDIPAVVAPRFHPGPLFPNHVMVRPAGADSLENERFRLPVCDRHQVDLAFVFNFYPLAKIPHQQCSRLASDLRRDRHEVTIIFRNGHVNSRCGLGHKAKRRMPRR